MSGAASPIERRSVGRPPRVDRETIAQAVLDLGLEHATMKAVAAHLGISVPGLYHHVRNRRELLVLAAERSLATVQLPEDRGQHWSEWLREWARYSRAALVEEPELFNQYLRGAISAEHEAEVLDSVVRVLTRQGFSPREAMEAWGAVGRCAMGSAAATLRRRAAAEAGRPFAAEVHRILAVRSPEELTGLRRLVADLDPDLEAEFERELTTLLVGMAAERGVGRPGERAAPGEPRAAVIAQTTTGNLA